MVKSITIKRLVNSLLDISLKANYSSRDERNIFALSVIQSLSRHGSVLNVGSGGKRHLYNLLPKESYSCFDIDMCGDCDQLLNLDAIEKLPFKDNCFDIVICLDVLEHLENIHHIHEELLRVSSGFVIISLPLGTYEFKNYLGTSFSFSVDKRRGAVTKYYGLPLEKPVDRHRWWISFDDIINFYFRKSSSYHVLKLLLPWPPNFIYKLLKIILPFRTYHNLFVPHIWLILQAPH